MSSAVVAAAAEDPFDLAKIRVSQDFVEHAGVKKEITNAPVRKPHRQEWVRVRPGEEHRVPVLLLESKEDKVLYLVDPVLGSELAGETAAYTLLTTINRQGVLSLWPIRLPKPDGRHDQWSLSAMEAADMATRGWVKVASNMSLGAYEIFRPLGEMSEPVWPDVPFGKLLQIAFRDRLINSMDHPFIRRLRGAS